MDFDSFVVPKPSCMPSELANATGEELADILWSSFNDMIAKHEDAAELSITLVEDHAPVTILPDDMIDLNDHGEGEILPRRVPINQPLRAMYNHNCKSGLFPSTIIQPIFSQNDRIWMKTVFSPSFADKENVTFTYSTNAIIDAISESQDLYVVDSNSKVQELLDKILAGSVRTESFDLGEFFGHQTPVATVIAGILHALHAYFPKMDINLLLSLAISMHSHVHVKKDHLACKYVTRIIPQGRDVYVQFTPKGMVENELALRALCYRPKEGLYWDRLRKHFDILDRVFIMIFDPADPEVEKKRADSITKRSNLYKKWQLMFKVAKERQKDVDKARKEIKEKEKRLDLSKKTPDKELPKVVLDPKLNETLKAKKRGRPAKKSNANTNGGKEEME